MSTTHQRQASPLPATNGQGVSILHDGSEYSTDLQKCIEEIESAEQKEGVEVCSETHVALMS
jgi:hypothetical protein